MTYDAIINEINKCDLVCANCHRRGHKGSIPRGEKKLSNRSPHYERNRKRIEKARKFIKGVRDKSKCKRCGESRSECLDFHHNEGKDFTISRLVVRKASIAKLKEAIAKCDVLCANCHRVEHNGNIWDDDSYETKINTAEKETKGINT